MTSRSIAAVFGLASLAAAQTARIDVTVERQTAEKWAAVDPKTVLDSGDRIRFRVRSNTPGWLYVYNTGSDGRSDWLQQKGQLMVKDTEYEVPEGASYKVSGPPGFDTIYWILTQKPIPPEALVPASARQAEKNTMRPRCRDLKPGESATACLDDRAGPSRLRARELKLDKSEGAASEPGSRNVGVLVYEFRIAHR